VPSDERVIFSGIQPTGIPHLGNFLGALKQWVSLQETATPSTKLLYSIVDLHAITVPQEPQQLKQWKRETLATLLAIGLDPDRSVLFYQSSVRHPFGGFITALWLTIGIGASPFGADVDFKLHFFHGISLSYDSVEG
jgi:tryptophanyl-tRNA synthetase